MANATNDDAKPLPPLEIDTDEPREAFDGLLRADPQRAKRKAAEVTARTWARRVQIAALILLVPAVAVAVVWPYLSIAVGVLIVVLLLIACADRL